MYHKNKIKQKDRKVGWEVGGEKGEVQVGDNKGWKDKDDLDIYYPCMQLSSDTFTNYTQRNYTQRAENVNY